MKSPPPASETPPPDEPNPADYPITDIRHYGVFPGEPAEDGTLQAAIDASSTLGITITWPAGLYPFSMEINRSNVSFRMEDGVEFGGTVHIASSYQIAIGDPPITNIRIAGTLVVYDRVGTINAHFVEIDRIVAKSDPAISTQNADGRGVHIYFGSRDIAIGEIIVEDMGGQEQMPNNHAAVAIDGFGDNPQRVSIGRILIHDSGAHGVYVTGIEHQFGVIEVRNYARETLISGLQDAGMSDSLNGAGVWFNRASATVGSIEVHGVDDGSRPEQHAGVIFDQSEIIWTVPGQSWVAGTRGATVETVAVDSGPGMLINPYGAESLAAIGSYFAPTPAPELFSDPHVTSVALPWVGGDGPDALIGTPGSDYLSGLEDNDALSGGASRDRLAGGDGNDLLSGDAGDDVAFGGSGDDGFIVDSVADRVVELAGEGSDRVFARTSYRLASGASIERLTTDVTAGSAPISLTGNELGNLIYGNAGANLLNGGGGGDQLVGLAGDDEYVVYSALDRVFETTNGGTDRVYAAASYALPPGAEIERLTTADTLATTPIALSGNERPDLIYGNAGANVLDGRGGADILVGWVGDDWYYVDGAGDIVSEAAGDGTDRVLASASYTLGANAHVELMTTAHNAGTAAIDLTGNALANTIYGNAGANVLDGKGGNDVLVGFAGADSFAFTTAPGPGNVDTIAGFAVADDTIVLEDAVFAGLTAGTLAADAFTTGRAATETGHRIVYNTASGALLFDPDGVDVLPAVHFATLAPGLALAAEDFLVV